MTDVTLDLDALDFVKGGGTITVVCQDAATGAVLMVAHADRNALERVRESGEMHFLSRSRGPWHKGGTSGNVLRVVSLHPDCDGDALLAHVTPAGPACHSGATSCFGDKIPAAEIFGRLAATIESRKLDPRPGSYTNRLLDDRNLRLKKLGEECAELIAACADADARSSAEEAADLVYHALVAVIAAGATLDDVRQVLHSRAR